MDYRIFSKQLLRSKRQTEVACRNLEDEIYMLEESKTSMGNAHQSAPTRGGGTKFEDRLVKLICICDDLRGRKKNMETNLRCIERGMSALSPMERELLDIFYINGERNSAEIAVERFHKERSTIYRELDKALTKFTEALYGTVCD